ncbi:MAG: class I SAM-dependent methyltransferase [Thermoguttaceae bacterium]|jgi:cyclopropane fatty-acyl-phospholipid synthase-like methyltransferase
MDSAFATYDLHYTRMANMPPDWVAAEAHPEKYACRKPWLPLDRAARILDFGCGWGHQLLSLWSAGYRNIEGVEISQEQAQCATHASGDRVAVHCAEGREFLADKRETYDLIILNDVLEHIPVNEAVPSLAVIREALAPGGRVAVRVPNMASLCASYSRYLDVTHVAGYTEFSLMQVFDRAGFQDHRLVDDGPRFDLKAWNPLAPWHGFQIRLRLNVLLHKVVYSLRTQAPTPRAFGYNLEMYSHKPQSMRR